MISWRSRRLVYCLFVLVSSGARSFADNGWEDRILSLTWENDATFGTDRHYTQGASLSYLSRDEALPHWLQGLSTHLPAVGLEVQARKFGLAISQQLYTPEDLRAFDVITNDRPYAGWLFATSTLQRRGRVSSAWLAIEDIGLDLGVIGPEALAEEAQYITHGAQPRGWHNQLKTEPVFDLTYERRYLYRLREHDEEWGADLIPSFSGSGGIVATFLGLGTNVRFGYRIPNEFEASPEPTPLYYGAYLFTGAQGRYVIRNIFLDGNTFSSSHHIEKQPLVADLRIGLTVVLKRVELTAAQTLRTREFKGQKANDSYGGVSLTVKF